MMYDLFMFHSLQCTMVNSSVAGSSLLFTFIEIMEAIFKKKFLERLNNYEKAFERAFNSNGFDNC